MLKGEGAPEGAFAKDLPWAARLRPLISTLPPRTYPEGPTPLTERELKRALKNAGAGELKRLDLLTKRITSPDDIVAALSTIEFRDTHMLVATRTTFHVVSSSGVTNIPYREITEFEFREKLPTIKLVIHGPEGDPSFPVTRKGKRFAENLNEQLEDLKAAEATEAAAAPAPAPSLPLQAAATGLSEARRREIEAEERYRAELRKNLDSPAAPTPPPKKEPEEDVASKKNDKSGCGQGCLGTIGIAFLIALAFAFFGPDMPDDDTPASTEPPAPEESSSEPAGEYEPGDVVHVDATTGRTWFGPPGDRTPPWERSDAPQQAQQPAADPAPEPEPAATTYASPTGRPAPPPGQRIDATPEYVVNFIANELEVTDTPCPVQPYSPMVCASRNDSRDLIEMTVNSVFELYLQPASRDMDWHVDSQSGSYVAGFVRPEGVYAVSLYDGTVSIAYLGRQQ